MSIKTVSPARNFLFHPLSERHSTQKKILSVITCIALSILTCGVFLAIFLCVNLYDRIGVAKGTSDQSDIDENDSIRKISKKELKKHNNTSSCWVAISGKVYDVTSFLEDHPGGDDVLLDVAGSNATNAFEDIGHTTEAYEQMQDYYIGVLV